MKSRIAIITGGGSGVGKAVALSLGQRGYSMALAGRREEQLVAVASEVRAAGGAAIPVVTDVTDEGSVDALFARTVAEFGRLDLLFNNAGQGPPFTLIEDLSLADWRRVIDVNLTGSFLCLRAAFRVMKAQDPQGGRIINNGSLSAQVPRPDSAPYTASKHAITGLTRTAALDGRKYDIAVGQIDIGNAASDMASGASLGVKQANGSTLAEPLMDASIVGESVAHMDSLPISANIQFLTVLPTKMPFIGRG